MTFRNRIAAIPEDRILVVSQQGELSRDKVLSKPSFNSLSGSKVAICVADASLAVSLLTQLDGIVEQITLLSSTLEADNASKLAIKGKSQFIICDSESKFEANIGIPVYDNLEEAAASFNAGSDAPSETQWAISTSGTTGEPKLVSHTLASLARTTKTNTSRGEGQKWGLIYDFTRFAGMQVLLQSVLSGAILVSPDYNLPLEEKLAFLIEKGCTLLSGTPTHWRKILMTPGYEDLPLVQATLGGEIADERILSALGTAYPSARLAHIFASTEAGVGFSVTDRKAGFPDSYLVEPPSGIGLKVENDQLFIRNEMVKPKYIGSESSFANDEGWVATGDAVEVRDNRVYFKGRMSGVINVGGDKVHPEEVERVLLSHPDIASAQVYSKSNPVTGALVAANIVLTNAAKAQERDNEIRSEIKTFAAKYLERHKVPAILKIVVDFQVSAAGKLLRNT